MCGRYALYCSIIDYENALAKASGLSIDRERGSFDEHSPKVSSHLTSAITPRSNADRSRNMPDSSGYERFTEFLKLTDRMIDDAPKSALAEAARMLAIQVGHYQRKFGVLPFEEAIELLETETLDDEQAGWIADGLENLAVAIASVKDDDAPPTVQ